VQIRKTIGYYPTREDADDALNKYFENPYDIDAERLTFEDVYNEWSKRYFKTLNNRSAERTVASAYSYSKAMHQMIFKSITITIMKDTIENATIGPATKGRMKSLYNLMYDYACESGIVTVNMARNFSMKGLLKAIEKEREIKKPFSIEDEYILWENISYGFTKMVLIGIYTGWRPQELAMIKRSDVDIAEWTMKGGMKTEAGTDRIIPIHKKIRELIEFYYKQSEGKEMLFNDFEGQQGTYMTYDKYRGRFKKVMSHCHLEGYTPHCTRHTFVTKAKISKLDEYAIKLIIGHETSDLTEKVYTHREPLIFMRDEIEKIK
jgi:integrase